MINTQRGKFIDCGNHNVRLYLVFILYFKVLEVQLNFKIKILPELRFPSLGIASKIEDLSFH